MSSKILSSVFVLSLLSFQNALAIASEPFSESLYNTAVKNNESFVIGFHSPSCGSCKIQKPHLESILKEPSFNQVRGFMADFDSTSNLRKSFSKPVRSPSTIVIFKNGQEVARILGETNKERIEQKILQAISQN